jgi:hypothetical protein
MCGVTYIVICVFDFLIMPIVYTSIYRQQDLAYVVELTEKLQGQAQAAGLTVLVQSREWKPITLQEGAFFHLAFGAVLTGAAITRGMTQSNLARTGRDPWHLTQQNSYGDDSPYDSRFNSPPNRSRQSNNFDDRYDSRQGRLPIDTSYDDASALPNTRNARDRNIDNPDG